jgi:putative RecB family exonuclease
MVYPISATKLRTYQRCPYAYYLKYERRVESNEFYGSAALGSALHQALAESYRDWHYREAKPHRHWFDHCWNKYSKDLNVGQVREGRRILESYYDRFVEKEAVVRQPLAVEGKIQSKLQVGDLEFLITGRYDRIDFLPDGLELIDYKSGRDVYLPTDGDMDLQIGLYYIALEQIYSQSLKYLSLLYLRTGEKIRFAASRQHKKRALEVVSDLAVKLRQDEAWVPTPGNGCDRCSYSRYCSAMPGQTAALPEALRPARSLQLALPLSA